LILSAPSSAILGFLLNLRIIDSLEMLFVLKIEKSGLCLLVDFCLTVELRMSRLSVSVDPRSASGSCSSDVEVVNGMIDDLDPVFMGVGMLCCAIKQSNLVEYVGVLMYEQGVSVMKTGNAVSAPGG